MIGISKLYCGQVEPSDALRYGRQSGQLPSHLLQFSKDKKPVVVWNMTQRCNLKCMHCYAKAIEEDGQDPITTDQAKAMIDDLAQFGAPVMLFSGGEPLVRKDLVELASHATAKGMRAVISTNGTLISPEKAKELKEVGLSYVGISWTGAKPYTIISAAFPEPSNARSKALKIVKKKGSRWACASPSTAATPLKCPCFLNCSNSWKFLASASTISFIPAAVRK